MMRTPLAIVALAIGALGCTTARTEPQAGGCALSPIIPGANTAALSFTIDQPDDATRPTAWQGPIHIAAAGGKACNLDVGDGIIAGPFLYDGKDRLFFTTYSGSNQQARLLAIDECKTIWHSASFGSGSIAAAGRSALRIGSRTVKLDATCRPTEK